MDAMKQAQDRYDSEMQRTLEAHRKEMKES